MRNTDYDFFVIGAGSAGVRASRIAASLGARTAICEDQRLGGTCVNLGCVPKKLLVYGSRYGADCADAAGYGWSMDTPEFDWSVLRDRKDTEIARLNGVYQRILESAGVDILRGRGQLLTANTVEVNGTQYTAKHILIAVGGRPHIPSIPGAEWTSTSDEIFGLERLPRRILIVGGGYIGVEFAGIFRGFGCEVTQVVRGPRILRGFDEDVRAFLSEEMRKQGIALRCETGVHSVTRGREGLTVTLSDDERVEVDTVLMATGRVANTSGLGLENAGVATDESGSILVDAHLSTNVPGIWACGDVINRIQLTPVALAEGMSLAHALFGEGSSPPDIDYTTIPTAVFSRPPVGTVGLTEAAARERGAEVDVYRSTFRPMKHTLSGRDERALMKLIVDRETDRVLGCHVVADEAGEILQGIAVAVRQGITKRELDRTIGIHPTAAEELVTMRTPVS